MPLVRLDKILTDTGLCSRSQAREIIRRLRQGGITRFLLLFRSSRSRSELVATFMAVLELCRSRIIRLAAETDSIYFEMAKSVIDYAVENYHMKLMDHIYLSLTDHLSFAARRVREGIVLQNFYTLEMKKFNPQEFQVGEYAVNLMRERLDLEIPADEAGNIAFHFINAQYDNPSNSQNLIIAHAVSAVLDIVKYTLGLTYNEDSLSYSRYVTHIRLFVQRLVSHNQLPEDTSPLLYDQIAPVCQKETRSRSTSQSSSRPRSPIRSGCIWPCISTASLRISPESASLIFNAKGVFFSP